MLADLGAMLNFIIVMTFTFLVLSLVASVLVEAVSNALQLRGRLLRARLLHVLDDGVMVDFGRELLSEPLLRSLSGPGKLPAYIPAPAFAQAVVAKLVRDANGLLPGVLRDLAIAEGPGLDDAAVLRDRIITWYDAVTQRLVGEYTRRARVMLFCVGLVLAVGCNINAIAIAQAVWTHRAALDATVDRIADLQSTLAQKASAIGLDGEVLRDPVVQRQMGQILASDANLQQLQLPIGWALADAPGSLAPGGPGAAPWGLLTLAGWLLSALAVVPGAKLWFDVLGQLLAIRTSLRPGDRARA